MLLERIQNHDPQKTALSDKNKSLLYADLAAAVQEKIEQLGHVTTLALALDNSVDWVLWDLAALNAGIPCVPVPPFFTQTQIAHALSSSGASHIVTQNGLGEVSGTGEVNLPSGTVKITYTSGTTGNPKGVCLSQQAIENVSGSITNVLGDEFAGKHICVLPLAVLLENVAGVYAGLAAGCTIHSPSLTDFGNNYDALHKMLKENQPTSIILVPEILRLLMAQIAAQGPLPTLKYIAVGGSKIDPDLVLQARAMGLPVYEGYGLSECASVVSLNTPHHDKPGTVGKLLPHVTAEIKNKEIIIRNPGFLGYVGEAAPDIFETGDLGSIDADGFLSVTGRKKNVLITSYGRNISPEWVESVLLTQPSIAQAIVYGDAQPSLSALIVPSSREADIQKAINNGNAVLPDYAQIKDFQLVPPFTFEGGTLTGTGRPKRDEILNLYTKENNHEFLRSIA